MIHIIFRTCEKVNSVHGVPRPFNLTKKQVIMASFRSLVDTFKNLEYKLYILADESPNDTLEFFKKHAPDSTIIHKPMGNEASMEESYKIMDQIPDEDIIYFVEDDYLHLPAFGTLAMEFLETNKEVFVHPTDYPDQYFRKDLIKPSWILLGSGVHWRQISSTTATVMGRAKTFKKYSELLHLAAKNADDALISTIYQKNPAFCPIPGLATHMHEGTMSVFNDWEKVYKHYENLI